MHNLLYDLLMNVAVLAFLVLAFGAVEERRHRFSRLLYDSLNVFIFCSAALLGMMYPWALLPDLGIDLGFLIILMSARYLNPMSGFATAMVVGVFRLALGGVGAVPAIILALSCTPIMVLVRRSASVRGWTIVVEMGIASAIVSILTFIAVFAGIIIGEQPLPDFLAEMLAAALFYPVGGLLAAWLMKMNSDSLLLRKQLKTNERRYYHLFEYAPVPLWEEDFSELTRYVETHPEEVHTGNIGSLLPNVWQFFEMIKILGLNRAAVQLSGASSKDELLSRLKETSTEEFSHAVIQQMLAIRGKKRFFMTSTVIRNLQGEKQYVVIHWSALPGAEKSYSRVLVSIIDTTTVFQQARYLRDSLERKKSLVREIHHRVRNSLTMAYSILGLQMHESESPLLNDIIQGSMNRIQAIALIHTQLYRHREILAMNIRDYLIDLVEVLKSQTDAASVHLDLDSGNIVMHIDQVLPLGIIINELVTNSIKHAFPPGFDGERRIRIGLLLTDEMIDFSYSDNGVGMDPSVLEENEGQSLGISLLLSTAQQLGGKLGYARGDWNRMTLRFPRMSPD